MTKLTLNRSVVKVEEPLVRDYLFKTNPHYMLYIHVYHTTGESPPLFQHHLLANYKVISCEDAN